jgi:hypothetical protein
MEEPIDKIFKFVDDLIPDIAASQQAKGLKASGASARSLRVENSGDKTVRLIDGSGSFRFQDSPGRGPTTRGASNIPLWKRIYDNWLPYKKHGFSYNSDKERKSLAFAIATVIHKKGNFIHRTNQQTNVVSEVVNSSRTALLREQVGTIYARQIKSGYLEAFRK